MTQQSSKWARSSPTIRVGVLGVLVTFLLVLPLALTPRADAYVYWNSENGIGRANLDGTGVKKGFIKLADVADIAVNDRHIYWTRLEGMIGRARIDGTGVDPDFFRAPGARNCNPRFGCAAGYLAVDSSHIYWTTVRGDPSQGTQVGGIGRARLDGTGVDRNFISGSSGILAVDRDHIYWTSTAGIGRAKLDGTGLEPGFIDLARSNTMYQLAINGSHIYWIGNVGPSRNAIGRADLDGSQVTNKLITGFNPFGGSDATGLALDALGPPPSNEFGVRGVKVNKKGSAKLTIKVAGPGELELAKTGSVKGQRKRAAQSGKAKLTVKAKGKAKKRLNKRGKTTVKAKVTYTPDGGASDTKSKTIKLVKR